MPDDADVLTPDEALILTAVENWLIARDEDTPAAEDAAARRLSDVLANVSAELARLRVIVDLSCAAWEAEAALNDDQLIAGWSDKDSVVYVAEEARLAAVAAEVARRVAL